jgi:hypothetical protein
MLQYPGPPTGVGKKDYPEPEDGKMIQRRIGPSGEGIEAEEDVGSKARCLELAHQALRECAHEEPVEKP